MEAPYARSQGGCKGFIVVPCVIALSVGERDNAAFRICPLPILLLSFLECQKTAEAEIISEVQRAFLPHSLRERQKNSSAR